MEFLRTEGQNYSFGNARCLPLTGSMDNASSGEAERQTHERDPSMSFDESQ